MRKFIFILFFVFLLTIPINSKAKNIDINKIFACDNGILDQNKIIKIVKDKEIIENGFIISGSTSSLVNTKDKCFKIVSAEFIYLIDNDQAIYKIYTDDYSNPLVMVDFNRKPAKINNFKGIIKGVGKYTYKDYRGLPKKIPYMIFVR